MADNLEAEELVSLTADIVAAFVSNNPVPVGDLPAIISNIHVTLSGLGSAPDVAPEPLTPAVPIKKSVQDDFIICLEDGKKFKSLKRHLGVHYDMTPAEYRQKWSLPADYPMVAPAYAAKRSELAKKLGLGRKPQPAPEPVKRGRRKAAATA